MGIRYTRCTTGIGMSNEADILLHAHQFDVWHCFLCFDQVNHRNPQLVPKVLVILIIECAVAHRYGEFVV